MSRSEPPRVCILSFSNIAWDSRVLREIEAARAHYAVTVIGFGPWAPPPDVAYCRVPADADAPLLRVPLFALGLVLPAFWYARYWRNPPYKAALKLLSEHAFDLIHANDWDALPVAAQAARRTRARVLFDAHEYTPGQTAPTWQDRLYVRYRVALLNRYFPSASGMITVSDGLQRLYRENFGWQSEIILNAPAYQPASFRPVDPEAVRVVHHGGAQSSRHLEDLLSLAALLKPHYHLSLMLVPSDRAYLEHLKTLAAQVAPGRVSFVEAARPDGVVAALSSYDVGVPWLRADCLNHLNALPNKFFDYVMAGAALAVPALPVMARLVEAHHNGVVADGLTVESLAERLNRLDTLDINAFKQNSLSLARVMNAETEMDRLLSIYQRLLHLPVEK